MFTVECENDRGVYVVIAATRSKVSVGIKRRVLTPYGDANGTGVRAQEFNVRGDADYIAARLIKQLVPGYNVRVVAHALVSRER